MSCTHTFFSTIVRQRVTCSSSARPQKKLSFWFGTGGAGFCLSSALSRRLLDVAGGGRFAAVADKIRLPDDVTMGYLVEHVLGVPLTVVNELHSHLEPQRLLDEEELERQISFSYSTFDNDDNHERNVVTIAGWSERDDPTRYVEHAVMVKTPTHV